MTTTIEVPTWLFALMCVPTGIAAVCIVAFAVGLLLVRINRRKP